MRTRSLLLALLLTALAAAGGCDVPPRNECRSPSCTCIDQETCTFDTCDADCELTCQPGSDCVADLGTGSAVTCEDATCAITVADDSTVVCDGGAICNVACTGACNVDCRNAGKCFLSCDGAMPEALEDEGECP